MATQSIATMPRAERKPLGAFRLKDGSTLEDLIDYEHREVALRVLADPEIFDIEMDRIFARVWQVVAHESEVPNRGDFVTRYLGRDSVIVSRDRTGAIKVVLNACTHRGMRVCRTDAGNSNQHVCPYHGWTFDHSGRFLGSPLAAEQMHGSTREKSELGLRAARVEIFCGMVFATLDEDAPPLEQHLGHAAWYWKLMFDVADGGLEVIGAPQRFTIKTNWKCPGEQHAGDGYHVLTLHRSLLTLFRKGDSEGADLASGLNVNWNGHGLRCVDLQRGIDASTDLNTDTALERLRKRPPGGLSPAQIEKLPEMLTPEQLHVLAFHPPQVGGAFPHAGTFTTPAPLPDGTMSWKTAWHAFVPRAPGEIEFFNWHLVPKNATDKVREQMARASVMAFGISGFIETDDADTWPTMYESALGHFGAKGKLRYGALLGEKKPAGWPGPGHVHAGVSKDDNQWNWWMRWAEFMSGDPYGDKIHDKWVA
jgi:phenylpropionate dioxygenase-like ring-hydroxylating dioxygenase large terminal subunit